jgi:glycerophosphoryl diester phosphodiesterase
MAARSFPAGVALRHGERRILLKWHMLRRTPGDPPHARSNLRTGLERGAVLEVDLQFSADGVGVCLHDETLDAETTGRGPVERLTASAIAALRQRGDHGEVLQDPPLRLEEVVEAVKRQPPPVRGGIQLDLKAASLDARSCAHFAELVGAAAEHFTVAGEDWVQVERLAAAAPGVRLGFEPLRLFRDDPPRGPAEFRRLAARMLAAAPGAEIVYLHTGLVLGALACGEDLVGRLVEAGKQVDCWTIDPHRTGVADTLHRLAEAGCGQITTNGPEAIEALWRGARGPGPA